MAKILRIFAAALSGVFLTAFGFFAGLQISPALANILLFPSMILVSVSGIAFGNFPPFLQWILLILTSVFWAWVVLWIFRFFKK